MAAKATKNCPSFASGRLLVPLSLFLLQVLSTTGCEYGQYTVQHPNNTLTCRDCPYCQWGQGLTMPCESTITPDTITTCVDCVAGVNFSSANDQGQCTPCRSCGDQITKAECTAKKDTECEKKCKARTGKYYDTDFDDCKPCTWCCGDQDDAVEQECLDHGMPKRKSCNYIGKKRCTPRVTPKPATTMIKVTEKEITTTEDMTKETVEPRYPTIQPVQSIENTLVNRSARDSVTPVVQEVKKEKLAGSQGASVASKVTAALIGTLALSAVICFGCWMLYRSGVRRSGQNGIRVQYTRATQSCMLLTRRSNQNGDVEAGGSEGSGMLPPPASGGMVPGPDQLHPTVANEDEIRSDENASLLSGAGQTTVADQAADAATAEVQTNDGNDGQRESAEQHVAGMKLSRLSEPENFELYEKVLKKLDVQDDYVKIAAHYGFDKDDIGLWEKHAHKESPTKQVLLKLETSKPKLTVGEFIKVLRDKGKKDVADLLVADLK